MRIPKRIKDRPEVTGSAKSQAWGYLYHYADQPMRCKSCERVVAFIDDGLCGSPKCRE